MLLDTLSPAALVAKGIIEGLSNEEYHAAPGVSKSGLDRVARSPAHYRAYLLRREKETEAKRFGHIAHRYILEPDFCLLAVAPQVDLRTKAGKEAWGIFLEENADCEIVTADEAAKLSMMRDAVYAHPMARRLLFCPGRAEVSGWWFDQREGHVCRFRPDYLRQDFIIADYKTAKDASPSGFAKSVVQYRYHVQDAFYRDGLREVTREACQGFVFIAQEKEPPYAVGVYTLDDEAVEMGRYLYQRDLQTLSRCMIERKWPAYSEKIEKLTLPAWAMKEIEQ